MYQRRALHATALAAAICTWAVVASAVLPPQVYQEARESAAIHVQVSVTGVAVPRRTPGECVVSAEVARVIWDHTDTLSVGSALTFAVSCKREGDEIPAGPVLWKHVEALTEAAFMDVFLNYNEGTYEVAAWQTEIIDAIEAPDEPTSEPTEPTSEPTEPETE